MRRAKTTPSRFVAGILSALGRAAYLALVAFHAWLLVRRLQEGDLDQAGVLGRWLWAFALAAGFWGLRRLARRPGSNAGAFRRRRCQWLLWALVLALHGGGAPLTPFGQTLQELPLAELSWLLLPIALLDTLAGRGAGAWRPSPGRRADAGRPAWHLPARPLPACQLLSRPPPALLGLSR